MRAGKTNPTCPCNGQAAGGHSAADADGAAGWQDVDGSRRGRRRRTRRSRRIVRRGRRPAGSMTTISIYNNNLNGFNGKKASIVHLLDKINPTVATFQETAVSGSNQIIVKKYCTFQVSEEMFGPGYPLLQPAPLCHQDEGGQGEGVLRS